jgi:hypothetical protein
MHRRIPVKLERVCLLMALLSLAWMGCSTLKEKPREPMKSQDVGAGRYYSFDDVLIPRELNYDQDESFVYESSQLKTGSLTFKKWRVDTSSLVDYFQNHMEKDHWKLMNSFQGKETVLNFVKPDKTCTIKIIERWYGTTVVEVRIGPIEMKRM